MKIEERDPATVSELKMWIRGFIENDKYPPSKEKWEKIVSVILNMPDDGWSRNSWTSSDKRI